MRKKAAATSALFPISQRVQAGPRVQAQKSKSGEDPEPGKSSQVRTNSLQRGMEALTKHAWGDGSWPSLALGRPKKATEAYVGGCCGLSGCSKEVLNVSMIASDQIFSIQPVPYKPCMALRCSPVAQQLAGAFGGALSEMSEVDVEVPRKCHGTADRQIGHTRDLNDSKNRSLRH